MTTNTKTGADTATGAKPRPLLGGRKDAPPPLAWWRRMPPDEFFRRLPELRRELAPLSADKVSPGLLGRALDGSDHAALQIAASLDPDPRRGDLGTSWLAVAAMAGETAAQRALLQALLVRVWQQWRRPDSAEWQETLALTLAWLQALDPPLLPEEMVPGSIGDGADRSIPRHKGARVMDGIGDADSREGRELARLYEPLTQPLALRPLPMDIDTLAVVLGREFPWMEAAVDALTAHMRLFQEAGNPWVRLPPLLLVGPPGVGKTAFAKRLARLADLAYGEVNASGAADNRCLAGTARGYHGAQPCFPALVMARSGNANPLLLVDELDKAGGSRKSGEVHSTLLSMLEPLTARAWPDEALLAPIDLGYINWFATANDLAHIPAPLLSRLTVVRVGTPRPEHFPALLSGLRRDIAEELGVEVHHLPPLHAGAERALREAFADGQSPRRLKAALRRALAAAPAGRRTLH